MANSVSQQLQMRFFRVFFCPSLTDKFLLAHNSFSDHFFFWGGGGEWVGKITFFNYFLPCFLSRSKKKLLFYLFSVPSISFLLFSTHTNRGNKTVTHFGLVKLRCWWYKGTFEAQKFQDMSKSKIKESRTSTFSHFLAKEKGEYEF